MMAGPASGEAPGHRLALSRRTLGAFRGAAPGCALALWGDIDTGLVLAADGDLVHPQEYLDAICAAAARALALPALDGTAPPDQVITLGPTGGRLVMRDPALPSHALVCLCAPDADLRQLLGAMDRLLGTRGDPSGRLQ